MNKANKKKTNMEDIRRFLQTHWLELLVAVILVAAVIISFCTQNDNGNGQFTWTLLNNVNIIVGFVTAIIAYMTWRNTRNLVVKYSKEMDAAKKRDGNSSAAIIIDTSVSSVQSDQMMAQVTDYCRSIQGDAKVYGDFSDDVELIGKKQITQTYNDSNDISIRVEKRFIYLSLPAMPEEESEIATYIEKYVVALENIGNICAINNISNLYLFTKATMPLAVLAGERFANKFTVHTHHWKRNGEYLLVSWQPINKYLMSESKYVKDKLIQFKIDE